MDTLPPEIIEYILQFLIPTHDDERVLCEIGYNGFLRSCKYLSQFDIFTYDHFISQKDRFIYKKAFVCECGGDNSFRHLGIEHDTICIMHNNIYMRSNLRIDKGDFNTERSINILWNNRYREMSLEDKMITIEEEYMNSMIYGFDTDANIQNEIYGEDIYYQ